ncbi:ATP-dependent zinc metalloprotease FtsH [Candidatus Uhrbacteria bacterium]|nr:ATP-dependent zinc metalloprotease FtsH [Candidatus Uhrbacteria bacterium]
MRTPSKHTIAIVVAFLAILTIFSLYNVPLAKPERIGIDALVRHVRDGKVKSIQVDGGTLHVKLESGSTALVRKEPGVAVPELFQSYGLEPKTYEHIPLEVKEEGGVGYWVSSLLPFLLPFLLIGGFIMYMMRQVQGANSRAMMFGQARVREAAKDGKRTKFSDVAGAHEAKAELEEVVEFLKHPKKFTALGAKIPKGVLLMGPPGTGKTLLARAVAGEANVPFLHMSASEFVEMFVGVGASRVRSLFQRAKKVAPCIVFVDELDAVGRQRGAGLGGGHDEREQTLNQILVEMDGFDPNIGIVVLGATNRPDVLDPALLRPGRFDRRVVLDLPDIRDREEILKVHIEGKPVASGVGIRRIAERTPGFSGADLANLVNEAALLAARRDKKRISMTEFLESIEKVLLGPERRSRLFSDRERKITAYHEGGHALVTHELTHTDPVRKVSIISRGSAAGYTLKLPLEDKHFRTRAEFMDELAVALGGYVAEREVFGADELTTGASNDLRNATRIARRLITEYGMSDALGPRTFGEREEMIFLGREITEQRDYSEKVAEAIDGELDRLVRSAMERATQVINSRREQLDRIADALLKNETIEQDAFEALFTEHPHHWQAQAATTTDTAAAPATEAEEPEPTPSPAS